ncbi:MAG: hypothetical protein PHP93_03815 [Kiritimatiellales bacterium]|nr:hypothetical protein [Kiritimatiellales bacterium]
MKTEETMKSRWIITALMAGVCAFVQAGDVLYDLNTPGELTNAFHTPYTGTAVSQSTTGGLNNSGSLNFRSGDGNQAWFSNAAYAPLAENESLNESLYFQYYGVGTSSIKLGFATDPNADVNEYAMPTSGAWAYFGAWSLGGGIDINSELYSDQGYLGYTDAPSGSFINGNWYQMLFGVKLLNADTSEFEFYWELNNSDSAGVLGSTILSGTANVIYSELNTTLYSYIGLENPTPTASHVVIDNISLTSTGTIAVPEPASALMVGFGGLLVVGYRRFSFGRL